MMDMGTITTSSTSGAMHMASATSSAATATATSVMTMDMSMDMSMDMHTYLTSSYLNYPVLFKHLKAHTRAQAFGIFCLVLAVCFVYKLTGFTLWYLEYKWSNKKNVNLTEEEELRRAQHGKNRFAELFVPTAGVFLHDAVRLVLLFWSTLLVYCLMLISMSFILTYVFAIVLGLSMFEVFFNRVKIIFLREARLKTITKCANNNNPAEGCLCGTHVNRGYDGNRSDSLQKFDSEETTTLSKETQLNEGPSCCCAPAPSNAESRMKNDNNNNEMADIIIANELGENSRLNADQMDSNLVRTNQFL